MNNFVQLGHVMTFTAPAGGVVSGGGYQIGQLFVVAANSAPDASPFEGQAVGVFGLPKSDATAWNEGQLVYWDDGARAVTTTATGNLLIGGAAAAAAVADTIGLVRLNGVVRGNEA